MGASREGSVFKTSIFRRAPSLSLAFHCTMLTRFLYPVIFLMRSQNVGTEYELSGPTEFTPRYNVPIFGLSEFELVRCESMPSSSIPGGRRSKRIVTKKRANLVIDQSGGQKM